MKLADRRFVLERQAFKRLVIVDWQYLRTEVVVFKTCYTWSISSPLYWWLHRWTLRQWISLTFGNYHIIKCLLFPCLDLSQTFDVLKTATDFGEFAFVIERREQIWFTRYVYFDRIKVFLGKHIGFCIVLLFHVTIQILCSISVITIVKSVLFVAQLKVRQCLVFYVEVRIW